MPKIHGYRDTVWGLQPQFTADQPGLGPEWWYEGAGFRLSEPVWIPERERFQVAVFRVLLDLERDEHYLQLVHRVKRPTAVAAQEAASKWAHWSAEREFDLVGVVL